MEQVKEVALSLIKPNPNNPRLIRDDRFKKLVASIKKHSGIMALRPIVVESWSNPIILGGNMRFRALKDLGYKYVPAEWVRTAESLTDKEREAFVVLDNASFGEWDIDILANTWETADLQAWGLELPSFTAPVNDLQPITDHQSQPLVLSEEEAQEAQNSPNSTKITEVVCPECSHSFRVS